MTQRLPDAIEEAKNLRREIHKVLGQIHQDYERLQYNTVVSGCMKLLNTLEGQGISDEPAVETVRREGLSILLRVLYPACPHITCALWQDLGYEAAHGPLWDAPWPQVDPQALVQDEIGMMLQVGGKLRGSFKVPAQADKALCESLALQSEAWLKQAEQQGLAVAKVIVVPGRLVNIVPRSST
jgi:leucyl-tRNA synthetase